MDFGSFENTIDKNIETDKASDKFDQQLQAYKDAGNSLTLAKSGVEMATASMHEAKDKLSEITQRYKRANRAKGGFGIGLSIVQTVCTAHHFKLEIDSSENKGSTFTIRF